MESFDSLKYRLYEILNSVNKGKIQLPDFQRGWVWDDSRIKAIIASVAKSFPIGAVMLLEAGNESLRFRTKPVEGVKLQAPVNPDFLILDGQQRITALFQAIVTNEVVSTRNEKGYEIQRWYYIDMVKAMDENLDLEESIISLNEKKQITANIGRDILLDLSKPEDEYKNMMYPVCMIDEYSSWRRGFNAYWGHNQEKVQMWDDFEERIINSFNNYNVPVIVMKKDNPKEAVCQVFEKVNTGGIQLNVFELLTATYASDDFDLKHDWNEIYKAFKADKILCGVSNTDFIQAVTLLSTFQKRTKAAAQESETPLPAVSCKRKDVLNLSLSEYTANKQQIIDGMKRASRLLLENHIFSARDLPYNTQLIPMSSILGFLGDEHSSIGCKSKIMQWYWCGVLGELYGSANETRYALDLPQVVDWVKGSEIEPKTVYDANFSPSRLNTLRTRNSAAYKGIYALLMNDETKDWITATRIDFSTYYSESIDIHHIFPVAWCIESGIKREDFDCIINKTPLSGRTNRIVSGDAPSQYLPRIQKRAGIDETSFQKILESHVLSPELLFKNDFKAFFADRKERILQRIESAMKKPIPREEKLQEEGVFVENGAETEVEFGNLSI